VPRRWATATDDGPLRLFTRNGPGWPFYARPVPGGGPVSGADVRRMRARQRSLGVPEAFEWVPAEAPTMTTAVRDAGLPVRLCPLLVLDGDPAPAPLPPGFSARLLGPADGDLPAAASALHAVAAAAFGVPAPAAPSAVEVAALRADLAAGSVARLLVTGVDGPVAAGSAPRAGDVVELSGSARLPGRGAAGSARPSRRCWRAPPGRGSGPGVPRGGRRHGHPRLRAGGLPTRGECGIAETP
jgi:hypothetical protein